MTDHELTRRQFVRDGSLAAIALAAGLKATQTVRAGEASEEEAKKIRSYHPKMEYRRCGRTNFMVSAVALGGHWKRIDKVIGADRKDRALHAEMRQVLGPLARRHAELEGIHSDAIDLAKPFDQGVSGEVAARLAALPRKTPRTDAAPAGLLGAVQGPQLLEVTERVGSALDLPEVVATLRASLQSLITSSYGVSTLKPKEVPIS